MIYLNKNLVMKLLLMKRKYQKFIAFIVFICLCFYVRFLIDVYYREKIVYYPEMCDVYPNHLIKKIKTNENVSWSFIESELADLSLKRGGKWSVTLDESANLYEQRVAIIVPYKNRLKNLKSFLRYMHVYLTQQRAHYAIYLIEQADGLEFNRAYLINIGFVEALKDNPNWNCFIYHDVDLLPENEYNWYKCQEAPTQFAITVNIYNYSEIDYFRNRYMGGVTAFSKEQFQKINGYSNLFFGWGGEDDDVYERCLKIFKRVNRLSTKLGKYFANCHKKESPNEEREQLLKNTHDRMFKDGLNSLNYNIIKIDKKDLFNHIVIYY